MIRLAGAGGGGQLAELGERIATSAIAAAWSHSLACPTLSTAWKRTIVTPAVVTVTESPAWGADQLPSPFCVS